MNGRTRRRVERTTNAHAERLFNCFLCDLHFINITPFACVRISRAVVFDLMSSYQNEMPGLGCLPLSAFAVAFYPDPFPILRSKFQLVVMYFSVRVMSFSDRLKGDGRKCWRVY